MLKVFLTLLFLSLAGACYSAQPIKNIEQKPEELIPYTYDFGRVKAGEVLKHDFLLQNESKNTLNIKNVTTSCGCTVSSVAKKKLLPGESTLIEVKFNSKGYSGPVQQYIYVHTDSLDKPVIRFIIKANVIK